MPYKRVEYKIICPICNIEYTVLPQAYFRKLKEVKYGNYCRSCRTKAQWDGMSNEEMKLSINKLTKASVDKFLLLDDNKKQELVIKRTNGTKKYWKNMSKGELKKKSKKRSEDRKKFINNLSEEELKIIGNNISKGKKLTNVNMSDDEKLSRKKIKQMEREQYWNNLSDNEKNKIIEILQNNTIRFWENITDEEMEIRRIKGSEWSNSIWNGMSEEERRYRLSTLREYHQRWLNNITLEELEIINQKKRNYYNNLSQDELDELSKKRNRSNNENNLFRKKFEERFVESYVSNKFHLIGEEGLVYNDIKHAWDYGIYSNENNELVMVVDLDGNFYHGDSLDYNGLHSKEEYDEKRYQSVPIGIKTSIIYESRFNKSFESMIKDLMLDYDEFINHQFKQCRMLDGIPYPRYTELELAKSYNQLDRMDCDSKYITNSTNTRIGDRIINHFHHSIYQAKRGDSKYSPYEAWYNDDLLKDIIKNRIIYVNTINPNKILQGFNISKVAQKVSVFSAGRAKLLINKYLSEFNEIFDPFSGFSGRMLGTISLGKRYIGQDISEIHVRESSQIVEFLKSIGVHKDVYLEQKNILQSSGRYECLFACPPYADKEQWLDVKPDKRNCDNWIDECISRFKCKRYLFVVDNTEKYKDYIVDEIVNKSHMNKNKEYVILI